MPASPARRLYPVRFQIPAGLGTLMLTVHCIGTSTDDVSVLWDPLVTCARTRLYNDFELRC